MSAAVSVTPPLGPGWQPPVLLARSVTRAWPGSSGLAPTSLSVAPGELIAVRGRPGSGKTTLVGLLAGELLPDGGEIERAGDWAVDGRWATWRYTSVVPAEPVLAPEVPVAEQLDAVLTALGTPRVQRPAFVLQVLDRLDLVAVGSRLPGELTLAQAQRVMVGLAVAGVITGAVPTLIVADEPTRHQRAAHADIVVAALVDAATAGAAVVVTTDDDRLSGSGRVVVLD